MSLAVLFNIGSSGSLTVYDTTWACATTSTEITDTYIHIPVVKIPYSPHRLTYELP